MRWALRKLGVDEWLIRTVKSLYTEAFSVVKTDVGFFLKFGREGWWASRVSSESTVVMDVVSSE